MSTNWQDLNGPVSLSRLLEHVRDAVHENPVIRERGAVVSEVAEVGVGPTSLKRVAPAAPLAAKAYDAPGSIEVELWPEPSESATSGRPADISGRSYPDFPVAPETRPLLRLIPAQADLQIPDCVHRKVVLFVPPPIRNHACQLPEILPQPQASRLVVPQDSRAEPGVHGILGHGVIQPPLEEPQGAEMREFEGTLNLVAMHPALEDTVEHRLMGPRLIVPIPSLEHR